jgi:hypothetical protein
MAAWRADVDQVGIEQAIMIARDNEPEHDSTTRRASGENSGASWAS